MEQPAGFDPSCGVEGEAEAYRGVESRAAAAGPDLRFVVEGCGIVVADRCQVRPAGAAVVRRGREFPYLPSVRHPRAESRCPAQLLDGAEDRQRDLLSGATASAEILGLPGLCRGQFSRKRTRSPRGLGIADVS